VNKDKVTRIEAARARLDAEAREHEMPPIDEERAQRDSLKIEVRVGELPRMVREAEDALIARKGIYQRGGQLVRIIKLEEAAKQYGVKREAGSIVITPVTADYLTLTLAKAAEFSRWDARKRAPRAADPPKGIASLLMACAGEWRLPGLAGLVTAPTLRADGSLLNTPGYDEASGLYGAFNVADFPAINPRPSREEGLTALALLEDVFAECAFQSDARPAHAAVAVAATITAVLRHALPIAPGVGISAHKQASGKTTIARAIYQITTGQTKPPVLALSDNEAELRKTLLSILIAGDAVVLIDNVAKPIDSAALCALLTSATYSDRVLGVNTRIVVPTATTWLFTGNNLEFVGDLTTRVLFAVLDPELEHPETRAFRRDLSAYVAEHRGALLAAALTLPLAFIAAGEPATCAPRTRFPEWDRLVRRPMLWLGSADPLQTQRLLHAADPVREALLAVLHAWHATYGDKPATVSRAIEDAAALGQSARPQLQEALQGVASDKGAAINSRRLGRYLVRSVRRIEDGLRFEAAGEDPLTHRRKFRVTSPSGVTGVTGVIYNPTREEQGGESNAPVKTNADNAGNAETPDQDAADDIPF
jgi:hypothetical protein